MEAILNRNELRRVASALHGVLPRRHKGLLPVLAHVLIDTRDGEIKATGTDLDTFVTLRLAGEVRESGALSVPMHALASISRLLPAGPVTLRQGWRGEGSNPSTVLEFEQDDIRFELEALAVEEFPAVHEFDAAYDLTLPAGDLFRATGKVDFAVSTEETRPILNGVLWETYDDKLVFCATNGHRLSTHTLPVEAWAMPEMIVHPKALRAAQRLFPSDVELRITRGAGKVAFDAAGDRVVCRLIEGPYPNWRAIVPAGSLSSVVINTTDLRRVVERALLIASRFTRRMVLFVGETHPGELWVSASAETLGKYGERVVLAEPITGPAITIGANGGYLLELLKRIPTDQVRIGFQQPERAMTIEPVGDEAPGLRMLLMPLRLLDESYELPWQRSGSTSALATV